MFRSLHGLKKEVVKILNSEKNEASPSFLITNFENKIKENDIHSFRIEDVREKGFIVKIYGLFAYVSFFHMPWKYYDPLVWRAMFPHLKNKVFFGNIFSYDPLKHSIKIDAKNMVFEPLDIPVDKNYEAIVLNKVDFGIFVEIGHCFDWKYGSVSGLLHKQNFDDQKMINDFNSGDEIDVIYWGRNENEQHVFGLKPELKPWFDGRVKSMIGEVYPVLVQKEKNQISFLVDHQYDGLLSSTKAMYPNNHKRISRAIKQLYDGDIIHARVYKLEFDKSRIRLKWENEPEIGMMIMRGKTKSKKYKSNHQIINTSIQEMLDPDTVDKLKLVGQEVNAVVLKDVTNEKALPNRYLVNSKYFAILVIECKTRKITEGEKQIIEENLHNGDIIECSVTGMHKGELIIRWYIPDGMLRSYLPL